MVTVVGSARIENTCNLMVMAVESTADLTLSKVSWIQKFDYILLCEASSFPMASVDDPISEPKNPFYLQN